MLQRACLAFLVLVAISCSSSCYAKCCPKDSYNIRSIDGKCNNLRHPDKGAAGSFLRTGREGKEPYPWQSVPALSFQGKTLTYGQISELPSSGPRPHARVISNKMSRRSSELTDDTPHSVFAVIFAQFVNHDLESNRFVNASTQAAPLVAYVTEPNDVTCFTAPGPAPIPGYRCGANNTILEITAKFSEGVSDEKGEFSVYNDATSYLDLSTVYGSKSSTLDVLRTHKGGKLLLENYSITLTPPGGQPTLFTYENILPSKATTGLDVEILLAGFDPRVLFTQGDLRAQENMGLMLMHIAFSREHNRIAEWLLKKNPKWAADPERYDEDIFQRARALTIAQYQHIVYEQYFPAEFGQYFVNRLVSFTKEVKN